MRFLGQAHFSLIKYQLSIISEVSDHLAQEPSNKFKLLSRPAFVTNLDLLSLDVTK